MSQDITPSNMNENGINKENKENDKNKNESQELKSQNLLSQKTKSENSKNNDIEQPIKKNKRHRRGKLESDIRDFKCPQCYRCYLSSSALKNHIRNKHDNGGNEKKGRGRPKKDFNENNFVNVMNEKYQKFFNDSQRKKIVDKDNKNEINISFIKSIFNDLFIKYKNELFNSIDKIEKNNLYKLVIDNWEKEKANIDNQSYSSMINCLYSDSILNKPSIDEVFFLYLKYISNKINQDYFCFVIKYIIIFREYINKEKESAINEKHINGNKREYTQIYNAEIIPDLFNDFLLCFMESHNYFMLDKDEIIELIEYFCFWLYSEGYTDSHISKI